MTKCRAIVAIGDDHGDNSCTFHCQLEQGHDGLHSEKFENSGKNLTMTWDGSEKVELERFKFKITRKVMDFSQSTVNPRSSYAQAWLRTLGRGYKVPAAIN